jgi:hypothetical protein
MDRQSELLTIESPIWAKPAVLIPVFAVVAAVAGALPSFSLPANLLVLATGGGCCWFGVRSGGSRPTRNVLPAEARVWLVPFGVLIAVEAVNFLLGSDDNHPTLSRLADPVLEQYLLRSGMFFGWLAAFWGLARR